MEGVTNSPQRFKPTEAANYLDVSISTLYNLARAGEIKKVHQSPKKVFYLKDSLDAYRNKLETA
jgi:predicted site-specific integrase-resolvase